MKARDLVRRAIAAGGSYRGPLDARALSGRVANAPPRGASSEDRVDHVERSPALAELTEKEARLAQAIGYEVARAMHRSPGSTVRPPSHTCPPVRAIDFDVGIQPTTEFTVLPALTTTTLLSQRLIPSWYGTVLGFAWTVAWDGSTAGNPYLSCPVTLQINGQAHQQYRNVTLQLTSGLSVLVPVTIPIDPTPDPANGSLLELVFRNNHATDAVRITGRVKGYQFPVAGVAEGIRGGWVEG